MPSFFKIRSVALYEFKTLVRSNSFRIFSFLFILILTLLNTYFFIYKRSALWNFRGISSFIPLMNVTLLNMFQAIIAMFAASEFLAHDKKHHSTDTVYPRSMTNAEYVIGKSLGVFAPFLCLNLFVVIMALVINGVFAENVDIVPVAYIMYPLLISIPTLIYIFGLSFLCMGLLRSQPLAIMLLMSYITGSLFFLGKKFNNLFDFIAYNVPFTHSGFVGFGDIGTVLIHRGIYFFLGLGFIFVTILLLRRLPQSKIMNRISLITAVACISIGLQLGTVYVTKISLNRALRREMNDLNKSLAEKPRVSVTDCDLDLVHKGKTIGVNAKITFKNTTGSALDTYIFSLNPGLKIQSIEHNTKELGFKRNLHIVTVEPSVALSPGGIDSLTIHYRGNIDEEACYTNIDEKIRDENFRHFYANIRKRYSFILPEYVLLTPENLWYPVAGIPYGAAYPNMQNKDFITFKLRVKTKNGLTALSQGASEKTGDREFVFRPEFPLPQLSLVIGDYEKKSITVNDVDYNIFVKVGHDYFSQYFNEITDKLPEEIQEMRQFFENRINLTYPYKRFSIIETPIHFYSYERNWTLAQETVQPEQVFLPEKGVLLFFGDFKHKIDSYIHDDRRVFTPKEAQLHTLWSLVYNFGAYRYRKTRGMFRGSHRKNQAKLSISSTRALFPNYIITPNFFSFVNNVNSNDHPLFDSILEHYFKTTLEGLYSGVQYPKWKATVCRELRKQKMFELLTDPEKRDIYNYVLKMKAEQLFAIINTEIGKKKLDAFLYQFLEKNRFKTIDVNDFFALLKEQYDFDIYPYLDSWYNETRLPGFIITEFTRTEVIDNNRTKYQVNLKIYNPEPVDGIVWLVLCMKDNEKETQFIKLEGKQAKEIGLLLDNPPVYNIFNTFVSLNNPTVFTQNMRNIKPDNKTVPFDGERIIETLETLTKPGEIIVDDEDPGFAILKKPKETFIKRLLNQRHETNDEYKSFNPNRIPDRWQAITNQGFYGIYSKSGHIKKSGNGEEKVAWKNRAA